MQSYIVTSGLSRRLVEAANESNAREKFCSDHPIRRAYAGLDELLEIHVASRDEVAEFEKKSRGVPLIDGQLDWDLGDPRRDAKLKNASKNAKEPA